MLALQHIHKSFESKSILEDINFAVNPGEVIALIGENGAGKTTLLKIILGEVKPDNGTIDMHHESIGYVPQDSNFGITVRNSFDDQTEEWRIEYALGLVGLGEKPKNTPIASLSGGQKTRLAFAGVLSVDPEPSILLLDEPTNNLDAEGLVWLESFVKNFRGGIVLVSHDRNFINKTCTKIAELKDGTLREYGGNYDFYRQQKLGEQKSALEQYEQHIEEKRRLTKALTAQREKGQHVHDHMKGSDNDKFQSHFFKNRVTRNIGQNAKMLETRLQKLEDVERPETTKDYKIVLSGAVSSSKLLLRLKGAAFQYNQPLLNNISFEIRGNERIHVKGVNGSGKTTLLKLAAGLLQPYAGECNSGVNARVGYFSQDVDGLDYELNGLQNLESTEASPTAIYREARSLGLIEQDLQQRPAALSRGQQAKLAFAKLLLSNYHLLILDEPTNHLDIPTREKIEVALQHYSGALLVTSHDRYFIEAINITRELLIDKGMVV